MLITYKVGGRWFMLMGAGVPHSVLAKADYKVFRCFFRNLP